MQTQELRTKLREFLNEKNMGLEKAAIYFDLSTAFLSKFLNDKTNPNERNLHKIRKGLGLTKHDEK
jgi:transcriptional regulator with XRE-family HTH domain